MNCDIYVSKVEFVIIFVVITGGVWCVDGCCVFLEKYSDVRGFISG